MARSVSYFIGYYMCRVAGPEKSKEIIEKLNKFVDVATDIAEDYRNNIEIREWLDTQSDISGGNELIRGCERAIQEFEYRGE